MAPGTIAHVDTSAQPTMAATLACSRDFGITLIPTISTSSGLSFRSNITFKFQPKESKQDKIKRIAKERRLASYKTYQQKTPTIIQIKQVCKPIHRLMKHTKK